MIFTIKLENMEFRASHGCYELEKRVGRYFLFLSKLRTFQGLL